METAALGSRLLENYVPMRALTADHLVTLMRNHGIETVLAGKILFDVGDNDRQYVYLLHGSLQLESATGDVRTLSQDDPECRFPVAHRQPRREKAVALTDCSVVRFDAPVLDNMLCWDQAADSIKLEITGQPELGEQARWMLALLDSNLVHKVPPVNLGEVLGLFREQVAMAGDVVIRQGDVGEACYFLKRGEARVLRERNGEVPEELAVLPAGRIFGEDALLNDTVRNATVRMATDGVLMTLNKKDFITLLQQPDCQWIGLGDARQAVTKGARWVDVRTEDEFNAGHLPGAFHLPLGLLCLKSQLLDPAQEYIVYCNSGRRSAIAEHLLAKAGFRVKALKNGFENYPDADRDAFVAEQGDVCLTAG